MFKVGHAPVLLTCFFALVLKPREGDHQYFRDSETKYLQQQKVGVFFTMAECYSLIGSSSSAGDLP